MCLKINIFHFFHFQLVMKILCKNSCMFENKHFSFFFHFHINYIELSAVLVDVRCFHFHEIVCSVFSFFFHFHINQLMFGVCCNHRFCCNCWREYITTKIVDEANSQSVTCAGHDCQVVVEDTEVMRLLQDSKVKVIYQHRISQSFVEVGNHLVLSKKIVGGFLKI